jgi:deoxyribodipyrimidine photo-lyase
LERYPRRNDPNQDATSGLSPWLHFGMISAQRVALTVSAATHADAEAREQFLEQLVVRRELADNFCLHAPDYDQTSCFPDWAQNTLDKHVDDERHVYSDAELEQARTGDALWNAAQQELTGLGTMHNYLRMYWAKKLLEWSETPQQAMDRAIRLNDRYQLDGRDSNGYAGIAWAVGGVHDRPWPERPVFGTIRSMTRSGAERKFDVQGYIESVRERVERERGA